MPDRFHRFTDDELSQLRFGLRLAEESRYDIPEESELRRLLDIEIAHVQLQREHRAHREALPA